MDSMFLFTLSLTNTERGIATVSDIVLIRVFQSLSHLYGGVFAPVSDIPSLTYIRVDI